MNTHIKIAIVCISCWVTACTFSSENSESQAPASTSSNLLEVTKVQFEASNMKWGPIVQKRFAKQIRISGKIEIPSKNFAIVNSKMEGAIGSFTLAEGDYVTKGQVLFNVSNPTLIDIQQDYLILKGQQDFLLESKERMDALGQEGLASKEEVLASASAYQVNKTKLESLAKKLHFLGFNTNIISTSSLTASLSIAAPISGYITQLSAKPGAYISPDVPVVTLVDNKNAMLVLEVLQKDIQYVSKGDVVTFVSESMPDVVQNATIFTINPLVNSNGTITVLATIADSKGLIGGTFATATIDAMAHMSSALPLDAIIQIDGMPHVLRQQVAEGDLFVVEPVKVKTGASMAGFIEVSFDDESRHEDWFLISGGYYLTK